MALVAAVATAVGVSSCASEDPATARNVSELPTTTVTGLVSMIQNANTNDGNAVPASGRTVTVEISNSALFGSGSGVWTGTGTTDSNGEYSIEVPVPANGNSASVSVRVSFVDTYTYQTGNTPATQRRLWQSVSGNSANARQGEVAHVSPNIIPLGSGTPYEVQ